MFLGQVPLRRRRLAGAERISRGSQVVPNCQYIRVRAAKDAPPDRFRVLERCHDLAEIVERGAGVSAERLGVFPAYPERESMLFSESASRHRNHFAHQRLGFIEAIEIHQGVRVVVG